MHELLKIHEYWKRRKYDKNWDAIERFWLNVFETDLYMVKTKYICEFNIWQSYLGRELSTIVCWF